MRPTIFTLVALGATLAAVGCEPDPDDKPSTIHYFRTYAAADRMYGTLSVRSEPARQHFSAVTQLDDGTCLAEEATTDANGRVAFAETTLAGPGGLSRIVFDARAGSVDVHSPNLQIRWTVPSDLPWVWSSPLRDSASDAPITTPLAALLALHAAESDRALRSLELQNLESHTIMVDQVIVPESDSVTVVLGDDAAEIADGLPRRIHLAALDRDLQVRDGQLPWKTALAAFSCASRDGSRTL